MWPPRLFWKLVLVYSLLNIGATVLFVLIVAPRHERQVLEVITQRLRDSAHLTQFELQNNFPTEPSAELQREIMAKGNATGIRITVISASGVVLADSQRDDLKQIHELDNHSNRPEIRDAVRNGFGTSERTSSTLSRSMRYYAISVKDSNGEQGESIGFVRTALSVAAVKKQTRQGVGLIIATGLIVNLIVLVCTYLFVARIVHPITVLTEAARAIRRGEYQQHVQVESQDELGELARAFNQTSKELAEKIHQLGESRQRLETVLQGMSDGVISVDVEERILFANAAAGEMFEFDASQAEGKTLLQVVRNRILREAYLKCLTDDSAAQVTMTTHGEKEREIHIMAHRLAKSGIVMVTHDVTESRQFESLRQEFVANVSHELKTPLSSIKAYAETLRLGAIEDSKTSERFLSQIEEQADRLHLLIIDLLSLARIESGQETFDILPLSLKQAVEVSLKNHRAAANTGKIDLRVDANDDLTVMADSEGLRQILDNLIDNAIKYTPAEGSVTVRWRQRDVYAEIEVEDTGIGIAGEFQPRLFERFYRVDRARSRELGSTGLGLSIVKHLTQSFYGSVEVESEPGAGSLFRVILPLQAQSS